MRIQDTEDRPRLWENLVEASDQQTKSKAIEDAARYYCRMRGDVAGYGNGKNEELLRAAESRGSLTPSEIAAVLDARELRVRYNTEIALGEE